MTASRVDSNQPEIVATLRGMGCSVQHLHAVGKGVPDLLVGRVPGLTPLTAALACLPLIAVLGELLYRFIDRPLQLRGAPRTRS